MGRFVQGEDRRQDYLLPASLDDYETGVDSISRIGGHEPISLRRSPGRTWELQLVCHFWSGLPSVFFG